MRRVLLALVLSGCGARTSCYVDGSFDSIMNWPREPTVGVKEGSEVLIEPTRQALAEWGWGVFAGDCNDVDICVVYQEPDSSDAAGVAIRNRGSLTCEVNTLVVRRSVMAHELGHCFGLAHREEAPSIMAPAVHRLTAVTDKDRATLAEINRECLGIIP